MTFLSSLFSVLSSLFSGNIFNRNHLSSRRVRRGPKRASRRSVAGKVAGDPIARQVVAPMAGPSTFSVGAPRGSAARDGQTHADERFENANNPFAARRHAIGKWRTLAVECVTIDESVLARAREAMDPGLGEYDALHVAAAIAGRADMLTGRSGQRGSGKLPDGAFAPSETFSSDLPARANGRPPNKRSGRGECPVPPRLLRHTPSGSGWRRSARAARPTAHRPVGAERFRQTAGRGICPVRNVFF